MGRFRIFFGKVILFGEYSVMADSSVLTIPYHAAAAQLAFPEGTGNDAMQCSNDILSRFSSFLENQEDLPVDTTAFKTDISKGLYFRSEIPEHMGLGSSGALCAAVFDAYKNAEIQEMPILRQKLATMESWFHGNSSGIDPLSVLTGKPLIIEKPEYRILDPEKLKNNILEPFLIDSGIPCETAPLVKAFRDRYSDAGYGSRFRVEYVSLVNHIVTTWEKNELTLDQVSELSRAQSEFLSPMIPESVMPVWNAGLTSGLYALKLCGSGGGGMFLGFTENLEETEEFLMEMFRLKLIYL